jgi:hypothetical protein
MAEAEDQSQLANESQLKEKSFIIGGYILFTQPRNQQIAQSQFHQMLTLEKVNR